MYLAGNRSSRTSPNSFMPFVLRLPCLSVCLSSPFLLPPAHTHVLPGKYPHPLHCHHGDTWPVTSLCCSSVLVSFFNFTLSFSLLCLADYEWIKQFCVNLQSSFDFFIYFISLMFHSVFLVVFGLFIFLQLISFRSSSFHSLRNVA